MSDSDRLRRIETRQEQLIQIVDGHTAILSDVRELVGKLYEAITQPASSELQTVLEDVAAGLEGLREEVHTVGQSVDALPEHIAEQLDR